MNNLKINQNNVAAIGIGSMIIFISFILVAGFAASILTQTSTDLEMQALRTGQDTTVAVSSGIKIEGIEGYNQSGLITKLAIEVSVRAGSPDVDLENTIIEISDSDVKKILEFGGASQHANATDLNGDVLGNGKFGTATTFGVNVLQDADESCSSSTPIINFGDHVFIGINSALTFSTNSGIEPRTDIFGMIVCEDGAPGIIGFQTPSAYSEDIIELK